MKKLEPHRCPWCGEILKLETGYSERRKERCTVCSICGNYVRMYNKYSGDHFIVFLIYILSLLLIYQFDSSKFAVFLVTALTFLFMLSTADAPYKRYLHRNGWCDPAEELFLGRAHIRWYSAREGGIGFPYFRITTNRIFAVCFLDSDELPVSHTVCVRLKKRFLLFWKNSGVRLISNEFWMPDRSGKTPWEKAETFIIFNRGEKIGQGKIRKKVRCS